MVNKGIIDPLLVTKSALKHAASVATTILSTDCVINNLRVGDESNVLHCGDQVKGIKEGQSIFYDKNAGHRLEVDKDVYYVIKDVDVVVIL